MSYQKLLEVLGPIESDNKSALIKSVSATKTQLLEASNKILSPSIESASNLFEDVLTDLVVLLEDIQTSPAGTKQVSQCVDDVCVLGDV